MNEDIRACQDLRHSIFVQEQNIPARLEYDGKDDHEAAVHIMMHVGGDEAVAATGRLLLLWRRDDENSSTTTLHQKIAEMGRIAVRPDLRGRGFGCRVVQELERIAASEGATEICLTPHHYLERFYQRLGYHRCSMRTTTDAQNSTDGRIYINETCQLISMRKTLVESE